MIDLMAPLPTPRIFDGHHARPERPTRITSFLIYEDQHTKLRELYPNNMAVVVRLLIDEFLAGNVDIVDIEFNSLIKKTIQATQARKANYLQKLNEAVEESKGV